MMKTTLSALAAACVVAFAGAIGVSAASDGWVVIGQDAIRSDVASADIRSAGDGADKYVGQVRFGVEGADVEVASIVLHWNNHRDDTLTNVGVIRKGTQTDASGAPDARARLTSATVTYRILGNRKDATFQVWGNRGS